MTRSFMQFEGRLNTCHPAVSVEFTCPEDSYYLPGCSDVFPVCFFSDMLCDRIADCRGAADELPSICGTSKVLANVLLLMTVSAKIDRKRSRKFELLVPC